MLCADVTNTESVKEVMKGAKGVIFAASGMTFWSAASVDFQVCNSWLNARAFKAAMWRQCVRLS